MKYWFKVLLIKLVASICFLKLKRESPGLRFIREKDNDIRQLAEKHDVYIIKQHSIVEYYIYGEPGRPLLNEEYYGLDDLFFKIYLLSFNGDISKDSLKLAFNPYGIRDSELTEYVFKHKSKDDDYMKKILLSLEIQKYFYDLLYVHIHHCVEHVAYRKINRFLFNCKPIDISDIYGVWTSGQSEMRTYSENEFIKTYILDNGINQMHKCMLLSVSHRIITMRVLPSDDKYPYNERLLLANDKNTLIIYNQHGRNIYKRVDEATDV